MKLDYVDRTGFFTLEGVPSNDYLFIKALINEHGLDKSEKRSNLSTSTFYTNVEYAAAHWADYATPHALTKLGPLLKEIEKSWAAASSANIRVPADRELYPFQKASLAYALERKHTLIADEPGLGKTPQAIAFANEIRAQRTLVICPASIRRQWAKRIQEWTTQRMPRIHIVLNSKRGVHPNAEWTICSYDLTRSEGIARALAKGRYDLLVLDEAHYLKTIDAGRTRAVFGGGTKRDVACLADCSERILALTGTPLPNRPREAYTLARHLCWDSIDWQSEEHFRERFNPSATVERIDSRGRPYVYVDERTGRHSELQNRLRSHFMVRHLKKDVLTQLPEVVCDIVQMETTGPVKLALQAESMLNIDVDTVLEGGMTADVMGNLAVVRHQMGVALAPQAASYAEMILEGGEDKLVIFAHHKKVLDILEHELRPYGVCRIDGSTRDKETVKEEFIRNPAKKVLIGNLMSVGTGTDGLQEVCRRGMFAECDWTWGVNAQGIDRLHRNGQDRGVLFEFLVAPGSLSEKILGKSIKKGTVVQAALDVRIR